MSAWMHQIPTCVAAHILQFLPSTDLLRLRPVCRYFHSLLTSSEESEVIWRHALVRDFDFEYSHDDKLTCLRISSSSSSSSSSLLKKRRCQHHVSEKQVHASCCMSIFGYCICDEEAILYAESAFEAWKHWYKASKIFYNCNGNNDTAKKSNSNNSDEEPAEITYDGTGTLIHDASTRVGNNGCEKKCSYINGPYFLRAIKLWQQIVQWCLSDESCSFGSRLLASFECGVSRVEGRFADCHNRDVIHAFEAIFAFVGGQMTLSDMEDMDRFYHEAMVGLFGGYTVYDHVQCTRLCSTRDSFVERPPGYAILGFNFLSRSYRALGVNLVNGRIDVISQNGVHPAFENTMGRKDAGLLWFEEYARRLSNHELHVRKEKLYDRFLHEWLSPFPAKGSPLCSCKVTRGIEVVASSTIATEIDVIVYSIRIRLLTRGEYGYVGPEERGFETCQLLTRHWKLTNVENDQIDHVNGDGVIGRFPLLFEGGYRNDAMDASATVAMGKEESGTFVYQSSAAMKAKTLEGQIRFVPGSIERPSGEPFFVDVGKFSLQTKQEFLF